MFKNAIVFRIHQWERPELATLEARLAGARFAECGATQQESAGWVEPRGEKHGAMIESVGGQWILKLCTETKSVPASAVKSRLEEQLDRIEQETGRRPRGKRAKELKEEIVRELLPRAFPKRGTTTVWIAPAQGWVVVEASGIKRADAVVTRLVELFDGALSMSPLQTETAPATAMAQWLRSKEAPAGFTIDRECELKQPDSEKATVRYTRHTLDIDEVARHIEQGKLPTQLALTWDNRVSFVLTESLILKKIRPLDVVLEGARSDEDGGFDADVALMTGELGKLIPDLVEALGGELDREKLYRAAAAPPASADAHAGVPPWEEPAAA